VRTIRQREETNENRERQCHRFRMPKPVRQIKHWYRPARVLYVLSVLAASPFFIVLFVEIADTSIGRQRFGVLMALLAATVASWLVARLTSLTIEATVRWFARNRRPHRYKQLKAISENRGLRQRKPHRYAEFMLFGKPAKNKILKNAVKCLAPGSLVVAGADIPPEVHWPTEQAISFEPIELNKNDSRAFALNHANYEQEGIDFDDPNIVVEYDQQYPSYIRLTHTDYIDPVGSSEDDSRENSADRSGAQRAKSTGCIIASLFGWLAGGWFLINFVIRLWNEPEYGLDLLITLAIVATIIGVPILIAGLSRKATQAVTPVSRWLIPGGMIRKRDRYFAPDSRIDRFDRSECAVLIHTDRMVVCIACRQSGTVDIFSTSEVTAFICAWLSTAPPPTLEQIEQTFQPGKAK